MIYLPWAAFLLAVLWMIRQGDKAKEEYLRRKAEEQAKQVAARTAHATAVYTSYGVYKQGQGPELDRILGAPEIRTPEQGTGLRWKQ
jgi:hypothetical protein